jgi:hypothetical protein
MVCPATNGTSPALLIVENKRSPKVISLDYLQQLVKKQEEKEKKCKKIYHILMNLQVMFYK